jgi:tetratricopeptide (TPR) repeat protein
MRFRVSKSASVLLAAVWIVTAGCSPPSQSAQDEQKEPHFLEGRSRAALLDYKGAVEAYERALLTNPRSASAHFELGLLCDQNEGDYAAAIYHYQKFLKLRPDSDYAERARLRITACKLELAKSVAAGPVTLPVQRDFDKLLKENGSLREELENCRKALASSSPAQNPQVSPALIASRPPSGNPVSQGNASQPVISTVNSRSTRTPPLTTAQMKTHVVAPGETPAFIARKYGLRVEALMAANPGLDAKRLQIGKPLNLPAS